MQIAAYKTDTLLYMSNSTIAAILRLVVKGTYTCISSLEIMH